MYDLYDEKYTEAGFTLLQRADTLTGSFTLFKIPVCFSNDTP